MRGIPPKRLLHLIRGIFAGVVIALSCAMLAFCVRWWPLGVEDEAYVHLRSTTIRVEVVTGEGAGKVVIAGFPTLAADAGRPTIALYPFEHHGNNPHEAYGAFGDILGWSAGRMHFLGFAVGTGGNGAGAKFVFAIPLWCLTVVSGLPLLLRWVRRRRKGEGAVNVCLVCGYDLRATPGRCPECGTVAGELVKRDEVPGG